MKLTTIVKRDFEIRDLGTEMLEFALDDAIDEDYELLYNELCSAEKILVLKAIQKQFNEALEEEIRKVAKNG